MRSDEPCICLHCQAKARQEALLRGLLYIVLMAVGLVFVGIGFLALTVE